MIFWRSVVGKLWLTILLLVSFVLFILTVLLLEFFENFNINQVEDELTVTASRIVEILRHHKDPHESLEISSQLLGSSTRIIVVEGEHKVLASKTFSDPPLSLSEIKNDPELSQIFIDRKIVQKELLLSDFSNDKKNQEKIPVIIVGAPMVLDNQEGYIFIYQTMTAMERTVKSTTKFILLAAGVAIVLTTIFAFFLSTRITAPLRKMREAAFEVAKGKFETRVPILTHDEIGELATAFNQMGKQLTFNMNALSQEKENLSSILSSMADGVVTINRDGAILATNPPAETFLQYWYYEKGFIADDKEAPTVLMKLFEKAVETESEQTGEISLQGHHWVIIVSPLYNNEHIRGAVAVLRDMTEERKLDKLRKDFIANVSHELRTPISMLQGYSEAIIDDIAGTEEEKKELARIIYDESLRMGRLVNDLLDLARMEAGRISLHNEEILLQPYFKRIASKFTGLAKEKNINVENEINNQHLVWEFDGDKIEQVMTNLIDNAIRHTPDGGVVTIKQSVDKKHNLVIEVSDSGTGIPSEDLPFVFERFYKADKARTRGESGTGLGLAIAKNIITAHGGDISVKSKLHHGTTFTFTIPHHSI
ncbi:ATP-binding protein [Peribacillus alkalitolerans]|uniref:ATP-binding protein n=1 Tax=Peribacillus alkalitolerans TaxID=1550385 RepID=UPI0013D2A1CE|nr:ATP-binding protein [Peribacillus alkalitolerans]